MKPEQLLPQVGDIISFKDSESKQIIYGRISFIGLFIKVHHCNNQSGVSHLSLSYLRDYGKIILSCGDYLVMQYDTNIVYTYNGDMIIKRVDGCDGYKLNASNLEHILPVKKEYVNQNRIAPGIESFKQNFKSNTTTPMTNFIETQKVLDFKTNKNIKALTDVSDNIEAYQRSIADAGEAIEDMKIKLDSYFTRLQDAVEGEQVDILQDIINDAPAMKKLMNEFVSQKVSDFSEEAEPSTTVFESLFLNR